MNEVKNVLRVPTCSCCCLASTLLSEVRMAVSTGSRAGTRVTTPSKSMRKRSHPLRRMAAAVGEQGGDGGRRWDAVVEEREEWWW